MNDSPNGPSTRPIGPAATPLSAMTDDALLAEIERRRSKRAGRATASAPADKASTTTGTSGRAARPSEPSRTAGPRAAALPRQVRQWLANLELDHGASLEDVEHAYAKLLERYGPALRGGSNERRADAKALLSSLKKAHEGLRTYFSRAR